MVKWKHLFIMINFHGIQGEFKLGYSKGKENQLLGEKFFYLKIDESFKQFNISKIRFHKNIAIVKLAEFNSINEVIEYKGHSIYIPIDNLRNNLEEDEFLVDDLIGLDAIDFNNNLDKSFLKLVFNGNQIDIKSNLYVDKTEKFVIDGFFKNDKRC